MKKFIISILLIITIVFLTNKTSTVLIPKDAIRFRIIANSDNESDQELKKKISKTIQQDIYPKLLEANSKQQAKEFLTNYKDDISNKVETTIKESNIDTNYTVDYGKHYFPKKVYKGVEYPEGEYESLVITLGKGEGHNWWCVLFPPLCLLEAEEDEQVEEIQYKSLVKEIISKYFER